MRVRKRLVMRFRESPAKGSRHSCEHGLHFQSFSLQRRTWDQIEIVAATV